MRFTKNLNARALRRSVIIGAIVAVLILAAGTAFALTQPKTWTAESVIVVLPAANLDDATSAAYYETLSRGQIVATFAEVAGNLWFAQQAEERLGLTPEQREQVTTEVSVVPNTAVVLVRASSPDPAVAEKVADMTSTISAEYFAGLANRYTTQIVHSAEGSAQSSGTPVPLLLAAALVVAVVAGIAVQQAVYHLTVATQRTSGSQQSSGAVPEGERAVSPPAVAPVPGVSTPA